MTQKILAANPAFLATFRMKARDVEGKLLLGLQRGEWNLPELSKLLHNVLPGHKRFEGLRMEHVFSEIGRKVFLLNGQQIFDEGQGTQTIVLVFLDVTEQEGTARDVRNLTTRLHEAREQEDKRAAHELHDMSSQGLAGLAIDLARQEKLLPSSPGEVAKGLREARRKIRELAQRTHELARRLHPSVLEDLGLVRAVRTECRAFAERHDVAVSCRLWRVPHGLPELVALSVYRVVQEALRNVASHARAKKVQVKLVMKQGQINLSIRDDGVGFNPTSARAKRGLGLVSMRERVAAVGGRFAVESEPGAGTTVGAQIPLVEAPDRK